MTLPLFPPERRELPHTCHARGCATPVKPEMLMCFAHWRRVPKKIQRAVWAAYRPGQCDDKDVSDKWTLAADAAIGFVAKVDRQPVRLVEEQALSAFGYTPHGGPDGYRK
jgi:hypothetical protein